jgi:hypothetical protein
MDAEEARKKPDRAGKREEGSMLAIAVPKSLLYPLLSALIRV